MKHCISNDVSKKFLSRQLRNRDGLYIVEVTKDDDDYIRYDHPIHRTIKIGQRIVDTIHQSTRFPIYFPINVICDANCFKHAQLIIVCKETENYDILFFDANGKLDVFHENGSSQSSIAQKYHYHDAVLLNTIRNGLDNHGQMEINEKKRTRSSSIKFPVWFLTDSFQINKKNLNPEGNCDAITLWYMHLNRFSTTKQECMTVMKDLQTFLGYQGTKVDLNKMRVATEQINAEIRQSSLLT